MKRGDKSALAWAVREAASWRGYHTGNPDTAALEVFDACLKRAREALSRVPKPKRRIYAHHQTSR